MAYLCVVPEKIESMSAGNILLLAEASPVSGEFPWVWAAFGAGMTLLFVFVALGYRAGWFLPKYCMTDADPMRDKLTLKLFGPPESAMRSRRQAQVVPRYQLSGYQSEGFEVVRVAFGQETLIGSQCIYPLRREDGILEDQVLVARSHRASAPMSLQEQVNELGRNVAVVALAFSVNAKEVHASRGHYRERLQRLRQRYDAIYEEYRQHRTGGQDTHALTAQLNDSEVKLKDLNRRLDGMR